MVIRGSGSRGAEGGRPTLRLCLGLLFATAASHKIRDPLAFRETLGDYELLPGGLGLAFHPLRPGCLRPPGVQPGPVHDGQPLAQLR